jgi:acyl-coenzyme A synthetase/AMP-(fatty) acid ligase
MDSMIKCSGFRISPLEVEEVVLSFDAVAEAVAFGVTDELLGQVVHVTVSSKPGQELTETGLADFCRKRMPHYMAPRKIHIHPGPMPRTGSGKLDVATITRLYGPPVDQH